MMKYELIPHTADVRLKVIGTSQEDLFTAALQGLSYIMKKDMQVNNNKTFVSKDLTIKSCDITSLLIDFLSEVLTASYIQKAVFKEINFLKINERELHAVIKGIKVDVFEHDIKAVTYHEANVHKNASGDLQTIIVFDL